MKSPKVRNRKKGLATAWIENKMVCDSALPSWIQESLEIFGIADNVKDLVSQPIYV